MRLPAAPDWSQRLCTVGVTGTNGKTTSTSLVASALAQAARPVPRVTTLGSFLDEEPFETSRDLHGFLATMRAGLERGARYAAIELTSEALALGFARAWPCRIGLFTNLTHDHLNAHGSPEHYLASKAQLFVQLPAGGCAVLNGYDPASELLAEVLPRGVRLLRYGVASRAEGGELGEPLDLEAARVELAWTGTRVSLRARGALGAELASAAVTELEVAAIGHVYAENALGALCAAIAAGVEPAAAARGLAQAPRPAGRFEPVAVEPRVVVDYAHSPDALRRTLCAARELCRGKLWVVFGAGGKRDQAKRPLMGEAAAGADVVVLTSDNPRDEDPAEIAAAVREGLTAHAGVRVVLDRYQAIRGAVLEAADEDVVVVAGKGHETEQEIQGERRPFRDAEVVGHAVEERARRAG
jgi:UDP-N-acetylmuramoyl-L-alanyl-D-glutamate--2,6-diaminopimelate ligase